MTMTGDLVPLFRRDLTRLGQQIEAFSNDDVLWQTPPQFTNPPGNLILHLDGNLREYVGRQLGNVPYTTLTGSTPGTSSSNWVAAAWSAGRRT